MLAAAIADTLVTLATPAAARPASERSEVASRPGRPPIAYVITDGVLDHGAGTVTPVNTATNQAGRPIKVGRGPVGIAITPNRRTAYVTNSGSGAVTPINTLTSRAGRPIKVGPNPGAIVITPNGKTAYVAREKGVIPISLPAGRPGKLIRAGLSSRGPDELALTPSGQTLYAEDRVGETVTPILTATNTALKPIKVARGGFLGGFAMSPDGKTLYVTGPDAVFAVSTATNSVLKDIQTGPDTDVEQIAIAPGGKDAYVLNWTGRVIVISTTTSKIVRRITIPRSPGATGPGAIGFIPGRKIVYIVSSPNGVVFPVSMTTGALLKPIRLGPELTTTLSSAIAVTPSGTTAYVLAQRARPGRSLVIPIRTATGTPLRPIRAGYQATNLTILP
jgi:DNA-binding beta-propeller fold protein YncE